MTQRIARELMVLAEIFEKNLSEELIVFYLRHLSKYPENEVISALEKCAINSKSFPKIGEILALLNPIITPTDEAIHAANLIWSSIGKFGYTNEESAKKYMGQLAWETVECLGGWRSLCTMKNEDRNTFIAQARHLAETLQKKSKVVFDFISISKQNESSPEIESKLNLKIIN